METNKKVVKGKKILYLDGNQNRRSEFKFAWTAFRELISGFRKLYFIAPGITVFGSARFDEHHPYYQKAVEFGKRIAGLQFSTITGGGPGIMEAANRGAFEAGGQSIGINIVLPHEQHLNPYITESITFTHFFTRKVLLVKYSYAFIIMPGGFGTMDEFFETLTLIQTKSIGNFPIVIFGVEYYKDLMKTISGMADQGTIAKEDLDLVLITDDVDEAMEHIQKYVNQNYKLVQKRKPKWWLGETKRK
ncbi:MAG: TIGR00730 family Rossman fold protein [Pseudopedobacter saltans]|uniref:Cytokinin riboside 5'-monophosphate phosphoribohydrolase n=1 Tax=Pseudopedobacter saltans TaxID=151895 RepID=A0A2W5FBR0_9SPHI|nr:MAG: TIGR00730 family Rossman fold protein [Pseudopedobacter saltans]